jgi:pimeloyl-ACP methyl ester carboxylesterase
LNNPLIFLVHGAAFDHKQFDQQFPCLNENYQIIRMDMAGYGKSRPLNGKFRIVHVANDIIHILDGLGVG